MLVRLFSAVCGTVLVTAAIVLPAAAADDLEVKVAACAQCHGAAGVPTEKTIPIIWGQQQNYLVKELHDYKTEDRSNPVMSPQAATVPLEERRKVAAYFAAKAWPTTAASAVAPPLSPDLAGKIAVCKSCHQQNFEGGAPAPRLAGLSYDYLAATMRDFAIGERNNNLDMPGFMKALSETERDAIARYLSSL